MKLAFVTAALALAATASAGVIEVRTPQKCIPEKRATRSFTAPGRDSCVPFKEECAKRHPEKVHDVVCTPTYTDHTPRWGNGPDPYYANPPDDPNNYMDAKCVISFGDKKYSYTQKVAKHLNFSKLVEANLTCPNVKAGLCASNDYSTKRKLICDSTN